MVVPVTKIWNQDKRKGMSLFRDIGVGLVQVTSSASYRKFEAEIIGQFSKGEWC